MIHSFIKEMIAYRKREQMYNGIIALKKNLDEMRAEGTIEDKKASDILVTAAKEYVAMF